VRQPFGLNQCIKQTPLLSKIFISREEMIMATRKSMWILFGNLAISAWVFGSAIQVGAETWNYKYYNYAVKAESASIGDVEGHTLAFYIRRMFLIFENGEVATGISAVTSDLIKGSGSFLQYTTITFGEGSTIIRKDQVIPEGSSGAPKMTSEIIKGTGRFEGIKGTVTSRGKFLPLEPGEAAAKAIGEGTLTFTLPSK
jgi:hypothetical protein